MRRAFPIGLAALLLASCGQGDGGNGVEGANDLESNLSTGPGAPSQDLAALVGANPRLDALVKAAGMQPLLAGKAPYTLLAPSDAALDRFDPGLAGRLDQPEQKAAVTALLRAHVLPGAILAADIARAVESGGGKASIATMAGEPLTITRDGSSYRITAAGGASARLVGTEQPARNGVVHQIDAVLARGASQ